ncbi:YjgB family protein [Shimazuella sp. AN120528]|uniref:YjgB family protein n=1 Tax=Shimazuella soli TaxID=1892854 RepID=UPI001F0DC1E2|nr:YjgB family protein [Shimazuella soli]MCH5583475.1 YjgB family protein [Shimazuella soli]
MKSIKITIITILGLLILNGCTVHFTSPKSNSTSSQSDTSLDTSVNTEHRNYLQNSYDLASQGKVPGCKLVANKNDNIENMIAEYGQPESEDVSNDIGYESYKSRNLVFGVTGRGEEIVDIRSYDPYLHTITRSEVDKVLGKPSDIRKLKGQSIYVYHVNGYEFKLIFLLTKDDPTIDHISVYSPDTTN